MLFDTSLVGPTWENDCVIKYVFVKSDFTGIIYVPGYVHYNYVIMSAMASQIASPATVYLTLYSGTDQRKKNHSSASLAYVRRIHQWPVNSPHKGSVTRKMLPFDDIIMQQIFFKITLTPVNLKLITCTPVRYFIIQYWPIKFQWNYDGLRGSVTSSTYHGTPTCKLSCFSAPMPLS